MFPHIPLSSMLLIYHKKLFNVPQYTSIRVSVFSHFASIYHHLSFNVPLSYVITISAPSKYHQCSPNISSFAHNTAFSSMFSSNLSLPSKFPTTYHHYHQCHPLPSKPRSLSLVFQLPSMFLELTIIRFLSFSTLVKRF